MLLRLGVVAELKHSAFAVAERTAITQKIAASNWRRRRLLVLCYHGVSLADEHRWNPQLYISPATLTRRFAALRRMHCQVLPLAEAVTRLYEGTLPPRAVALTFDDGFYDFRARALPILQAFGYPATIYVTTHRVHRNPVIAHLLASYMLWKVTTGEGSVASGESWAPLHPDDEGAFAREVIERLGVRNVARHNRLLSVMTAEELAEVAAAGVAVEMHTHRHVAPEDPGQFIDEVRRNRAAITEITGREPRHLCYPSGVYRDSYLAYLRSDAVATATTCDPALASTASHPLKLPRFVDSEACSPGTFEAWVSGVAMWLPRRTRSANAVA